MLPLRERPGWQAYIISIPWAIGSVLGPVLGGTLAVKTTWRWIFWFNIPFCVIAAIGIPVCLRLHLKEGSLWVRLREFDWFGSFMFVAATTSFLIPITWGGVMYEWQSWRTLVPLIVGVASLTGFMLYSVYISRIPLIARSLFNTPTAIVAYIGTIVQGLIVWSLLYYMPIYFEVAKNYSPISSGCAVMPFTLTVAPAAVVVGLIIKKTGRYRPSQFVGWFLTVLGMGLLIYLKKDTSMPAWILMSLVPGVGLGMLFSALGFAASASVSNADLPFAGALYSFFRAFGQTLGVAVSGVIFQNSFKKQILATAYRANADLWSSDASALVQVVKAWSDTGAEGVMKSRVIEAYVESLKMVWLVMTVLAGVTFIVSLIWTAEISLTRDLETEQGFRHDLDEKKTNDMIIFGAVNESMESFRTARVNGSDAV
ncbi:Efflux pump [Hyphodiscus hymeniophilus]|uniref:Efflux pump n=1 Tax=Hyphodiscus hymeniophilus TaxID=353542 RepID=A0A9P6VP90_9HELO|nr:Efflux pump [Hyphodiscus hymeniophilus]